MLYVIRDKFGSALAVLWGALKSFSKNNNFSTAASLAYCSLFAMVPILLLLFFTMSLFITSSKAVMQRITALIAQFIPYYSDAVLKEVYTLARHKGTWGLISMGALLWASMPLVGTLRTAFFEIFRIEKRPSFLKTKLLDISVILITISLFVTVSFSNLVFKEFLIFKGNKVLYDIASYGLITIISVWDNLRFVKGDIYNHYMGILFVQRPAFWG
ncbi:MAG: YihY/virulence factor BrkB family protein [Nitrospirae bacterium]|nr:YihY/virulence factor BrkB family protein [Nitrospirota bacterium]